MKFRKKPVVIEAVKFNTPNADGHYSLPAFSEWPEWLHQAVEDTQTVIPTTDGHDYDVFDIVTLEGTMRVNPGDWIIRGVNGELYPCKPDIFAKTYERVE